MKAGDGAIKTSKEIALIGGMSALLLGGQLALSAVAGVEVVTVLTVAFSSVFGIRRGCTLAVVFSLLRCILFGFFPSVVILYLIYWPLLAFITALSSKGRIWSSTPVLTAEALVMTLIFPFISVCIDSFMYGVKFIPYMTMQIPVTVLQLICVAATCLFLLPVLRRLFGGIKNSMGL